MASPPVSAPSLLKEGHEQLRGFFARYRTLKDEESRFDLFERIQAALSLHTAIEEEVFYPACDLARGNSYPDVLSAARKAHAEIRTLLRELSHLPIQAASFGNRMNRLREKTEAHVRAEEKEIFPLFRKLPPEVQEEASRRLAERRREKAG